MNLLTCILTENDCYKAERTINPKGVMVHSTGANNPNLKRYVQPVASTKGRAELLAKLGTNANSNHWNQPRVYIYTDGTRTVGYRNTSKTLKQTDYAKCVHGFIGKLADGSVAAVQTLPWSLRGWHSGTGSKGSANDTHISFEICEDGLTDPDYFRLVYREAVELTAYLCGQYGLDPLADGVVICHQEGYRRGVTSNHGDVLHWFPRYGKSVDDFRTDVAAELGREPETPALAPAAGYDAAKAGTYTVAALAGLNIRTGAGTGPDKVVLGTLPFGTQAVCYGYYSSVGGEVWLLVTAGKYTGYVSSKHLKAEPVPPVDGSTDENTKEDDDMAVIYKKLGDVADSYRPTIRKLMERGALKGHSDPDPNSLEDNVLNVSEDYCRVMTTLDRLGKLD